MYPQPVFEVYPQNGISHPIVAFTHRDYLSLNNKIISIDRKLPDDVVKIHPTFTNLCYKLRPMLTDPAAFFMGKECLEDPQDMWGNSLITQIGRVLNYLLERKETAPFVKTVKIFVPFYMVGSVEHLPELSDFPHVVHKPAMTYGMSQWPMQQYRPQTFGGGMLNVDLQKAWKEGPFNANPPVVGAKVTNQISDKGCAVPIHPEGSASESRPIPNRQFSENEQNLDQLYNRRGQGFAQLDKVFYQDREGTIVKTHLPTGGEAVEEKEVELHEVANIIRQCGMVDEWKVLDGFIVTNCFGGYHMKLINENAEHFIVKIPFGYPIVGKGRQIFVLDQILVNDNAELFRDLAPGQTYIRQEFHTDKDTGKPSDSDFNLFITGVDVNYLPIEHEMFSSRFNNGVNGFSYSARLDIFDTDDKAAGEIAGPDTSTIGVNMFELKGLTFSHHHDISNVDLLIADGDQPKLEIERTNGKKFTITTDHIHAVYKSTKRYGWVIVYGEKPSIEHTTLNEMLALLNVKTENISQSYHFPFKQSK